MGLQDFNMGLNFLDLRGLGLIYLELDFLYMYMGLDVLNLGLGLLNLALGLLNLGLDLLNLGLDLLSLRLDLYNRRQQLWFLNLWWHFQKLRFFFNLGDWGSLFNFGLILSIGLGSSLFGRLINIFCHDLGSISCSSLVYLRILNMVFDSFRPFGPEWVAYSHLIHLNKLFKFCWWEAGFRADAVVIFHVVFLFVWGKCYLAVEVALVQGWSILVVVQLYFGGTERLTVLNGLRELMNGVHDLLRFQESQIKSILFFLFGGRVCDQASEFYFFSGCRDAWGFVLLLISKMRDSSCDITFNILANSLFVWRRGRTHWGSLYWRKSLILYHLSLFYAKYLCL